MIIMLVGQGGTRMVKKVTAMKVRDSLGQLLDEV